MQLVAQLTRMASYVESSDGSTKRKRQSLDHLTAEEKLMRR